MATKGEKKIRSRKETAAAAAAGALDSADDSGGVLLSELEESLGKIDELQKVANELEEEAPENLRRVEINLDDISVSREQRELSLLRPYAANNKNPFTNNKFFFYIEHDYVNLLKNVKDDETLSLFKRLLEEFSKSRIKVYTEIFKKLSNKNLSELIQKVLPLKETGFNLFDDDYPHYFWNIRLDEFGLSQKENYERLLDAATRIENISEQKTEIDRIADDFFNLCEFGELSRIFMDRGNEEREEDGVSISLFDKLGLESGEDNDTRTIYNDGVVTRKQISDLMKTDLKSLINNINRNIIEKTRRITNNNSEYKEEESRILLKIIFEAQLHKIYYYWSNCLMLRKNKSWLQYEKGADNNVTNIDKLDQGVYFSQHDVSHIGPIVLESCFKDALINNEGNLNNVRKQISADLLKILVGIDVFMLLPSANLIKKIKENIYQTEISLHFINHLPLFGLTLMQSRRKLEEISVGDTLVFTNGETKGSQIERKQIEGIEEDKIVLFGGEVITKENYYTNYRSIIDWQDSNLSREANVNEIILDLLVLTRSEFVVLGTSIFLNDYTSKAEDEEDLFKRIVRVLANNKTKDEKIMNIGKSLRKVLKGQIPGDGYNSIYFPVEEPEKGIDLYHDKMGVVAFNASRERWHNSDTCEITGERFTRTIRKHHCRACGRTIRDSVSKKRCKLVKVRYSEDDERFIEDGILSGNNRRICDICYSKMSLDEKRTRECPSDIESKS